ncbi:hypothetical protein GT037_002020, partial [Alternaria burnsii]
ANALESILDQKDIVVIKARRLEKPTLVYDAWELHCLESVSSIVDGFSKGTKRLQHKLISNDPVFTSRKNQLYSDVRFEPHSAARSAKFSDRNLALKTSI